MSVVKLTKADAGFHVLIDWLAAHGLNARHVCALPGAEPIIRDGRLTATVYVLDENGERIVDRTMPPSPPGSMPPFVVDLVDVPVHTPLPDWLGTVVEDGAA